MYHILLIKMLHVHVTMKDECDISKNSMTYFALEDSEPVFRADVSILGLLGGPSVVSWELPNVYNQWFLIRN